MTAAMPAGRAATAAGCAVTKSITMKMVKASEITNGAVKIAGWCAVRMRIIRSGASVAQTRTIN